MRLRTRMSNPVRALILTIVGGSLAVVAGAPSRSACEFKRTAELRAQRPSAVVPEAWRRVLAPSAVWGPRWHTATGDWAAAVSWDGGASATLTLAYAGPDGGLALEQGEISAGWSDRYQEGFAPELVGAPVVIGGRPFPLVQREAMGHGGGGGPLLSIIVPATDGGLRERQLGGVEGFTNINFVAVAKDRCRGGVFASPDGTALRLDRCFDDAPAPPLCFVWDRRASDYRLEPSGPRRE